MNDGHPTGEVRPVRGLAAGFVPPEPCQSLWNRGSSASGAGMGIPVSFGVLRSTFEDRPDAGLQRLNHHAGL